MTQIEPLKKMPKDVLPQLASYAKQEVQDILLEFGKQGFTADALFWGSDEVWLLRNEENIPLLIAGVIKGSLLGKRPELWILMCEEMERNPRKYLRWVRELTNRLKDLYPGLRANAEPIKKTTKFAKFFGFKPVGIDGKYTTYEA